MWGDIYMSAGARIGSYIVARRQAKIDRQWQKYNNTMVRFQNAINQNALTMNEIFAMRKHQQQATQIQRSEHSTKASVELSAAATGTVGKSVNMQLIDVSRKATEAQKRNTNEMRDSMLQISHQRQQSAMGMQMSLDLRNIPSPSPLTYALGFAGDVMDNPRVRERLGG